jgi:hypothetical protein
LCPLAGQPGLQDAVFHQTAQTQKALSARASMGASAPHDAGVILVAEEQKLGKSTPIRASVANR